MDIRIDVRKRETPVAYVIDCTLEFECFNKSKGKHDMGEFKGNCVVIWHLDQNMYYDLRVLKSFSLIYATATISTNMSIILWRVGRGREPWKRSEDGGVIGNERHLHHSPVSSPTEELRKG